MYENYERILKERGLTNYKVSKDTGIAQSVLSTWKTKGTTPKADKLQILAEYLGVSIDYLLGVQPNVQSEEYYQNDEASRAAQEAFDDPDLRILFDAAKGSRPEDIRMAAEMLMRLKGTNPDG
jgi:transcriptional regulator with XRE-family HTH domain